MVSSEVLYETVASGTIEGCKRAFPLAALSAMALPLVLGLSVGAAARALELPLSGLEATDGLATAALGVHQFGRSGAWLVMIQSAACAAATACAELTAFSVILTKDVFAR